MNESYLLMIALIGNFLTFVMGLVGIIYSYRMGFYCGCRIVNREPIIEERTEKAYDDSGKEVLDEPDIFTESLNSDGIDDKNKRLRTV